MDTSDPDITFNSVGHCNHCTEFLEIRANHNYQGESSDQRLSDLVATIRSSTAGPYDCVIGMSGGTDSSYLAVLVKELGLNPLAVHMDNGWDSEEAVVNIRNITTRLDIDYESYVLDWEEFRDIQLAFLKASIPEAETPTDIAIVAALHHYAAKFGIKYIVSGGNLTTEGILPKTWHYDARDLRYFRHIQRSFGERPLNGFPTFGYKREIYYKFFKGIQTVYPLNMVPYSRSTALERLTNEFDYKFYGRKHYESRYTRFIQSYYLYEKFGVDYRRATLSTQICNGIVDRQSALEKLREKPYNEAAIDVDKEYIVKKLDISRSEFEAILSYPPKWYRDYPNDESKLALLYSTYRKLFNKEKLASV